MIWDRNQPQAPPQYPTNFQNPYMAPRPSFPPSQLPAPQSTPGLPNLSMQNIQALINKMGGVDGLIKMAGEIQKLYQTAQPIINLMAGLLAKPSSSESDSTSTSEPPVKRPKRKKRPASKRKGRPRKKAKR